MVCVMGYRTPGKARRDAENAAYTLRTLEAQRAALLRDAERLTRIMRAIRARLQRAEARLIRNGGR